MLTAQGLLGQRVGLLNEDLRQQGQGSQGLLDGGEPEQVTDPDVEDLAATNDAQAIETTLD